MKKSQNKLDSPVVAHLSEGDIKEQGVLCLQRRKKTFQNYVKSGMTSTPFALSLELSALPDRKCQILSLLGPTGCGKSHLAEAIVHFRRNIDPNARIYFFSADSMNNLARLILELKTNRLTEQASDVREPSANARPKTPTLLIVDGIEHLAEKDQVLVRIFADHILGPEKQLVFTGNLSEEDLPLLEENFLHLIQSGHLVHMLRPTLPHRAEIIQKKAEAQGVTIDEGAAYLLAHTEREDVSKLENLLATTIATSKRSAKVVTVQTVKDSLRIGLPSASQIEVAVCSYNHVRPRILQSRSRIKRYQLILAAAMYLMNKVLQMDDVEIATRFPVYTKSEVHALIQDIAHQRSSDPEFHHEMYLMESMVGFSDASQSCCTDSK